MKLSPIKSGLQIPKSDIRRFKYSKSFGASPLHDNDFVLEGKIKNQETSDLCVAFSLSTIREKTEKVEISPEYLFAKAKEKEGSIVNFGSDPFSMASIAVKVGALEQSVSPMNLSRDGRDKCADWKNYPSYLDDAAKTHKAGSYFEVKGFDEFRSVMQTRNIPVQAGVYWQYGWTDMAGGIIPEYEKSIHQSINPHAIAVVGQKKINGKMYLVIQNSYGDEVGDKGLFYFPKSQVDKFIFGLCVLDEDPEAVKRQQWNLLQKMVDWLYKVLATLNTPKPTITTDNLVPIDEEIPPAVKPIEIPTVETKEHTDLQTREVNLENFCLAIEKHEGFYDGSRSQRNNNPGNMKFTEYTKSMGATHADKGGFAVFPNYYMGLECLRQFIRDASNDKLKNYKQCTIYSFFSKYAPPFENNVETYANFVAHRCGVSIDTKLSDFI